MTTINAQEFVNSLAATAQTLGFVMMPKGQVDKISAELTQLRDSHRILSFLQRVKTENLSTFVSAASFSKAQLRQDLLVLLICQFKRDGYFVEFGATDGITLSNTYLLETKFGWRGILAEPGLSWHSELVKNRGCSVDTSCVWSESNKTLVFNETPYKELSTIDAYSDKDLHSQARIEGKRYEVTTVSLNELLEIHGAPSHIDYLSVDTEGSEFEILNAFDFSRHSFSVITVEHNFSEQRNAIFQLLSSKGYKRAFENLSEFDDWYISV